MSRQRSYDAIVVGSGITGGWAAKELTEKGLAVLLLERGRLLRHGADYSGEHRPEWEYRFRHEGDRPLYEAEYPIQRQCYAFAEPTQQFFVNDKEHPYKQADGKPFSWIRGYHLGGRSLMWARQSYRWSDLDFEANARDGFGVDWPIRYADLAPWYDYVESFAGISGQPEGLPQLPDGRFLPPMEMNCVERAVKQRLEAAFPERTMTIGRVAVLTRAHNGRAACHYCGPCERGCSTGSYFSSLSATLPAAMATGRLTIRPHSVVHSVLFDPARDRATGVRVIDAESHETLDLSARLVFLCASTLGTTQILLRSTSSRFPRGLGNPGDVLGHYLMDHTFGVGASGVVAGFEDSYTVGVRPNGIYVPRFRNLQGPEREYLRGFGFQGGASRAGWERGLHTPGFGAELKRRLRDPGPWRMSFGGFGECLPRHENHVELDDEVDAWGLPLLKVHCAFGDNERRIRADAAACAAEMLEAAGAVDVNTYDDGRPPGLGIHEMGTARMGRDPETSVLNGHNQVHGAANVFVTDGSCMASSACQNPSLTYMALTARACDFAVGALRLGEL